jgi:hypothetical protein
MLSQLAGSESFGFPVFQAMPPRSSPEPYAKARSVHDKRPLNMAVFFTLVHYLCLIGFLTSLGILIAHPAPGSVPPVVAFAVATLVTWLVSFVRRRSARCPLCKGSPLYDSGAVKHAKAHRMRPLNHGATAVLSILFLNRFRCMYCGTPYDMLKAPSTARHKHQELP